MLNSRKGQEMSVNVLVGIILGIIMLAAAMFLFFNIMGKTNKTSDQLDEATRNKINVALDSGDPIYVPVTNIDVKKGTASFWVGIKNIGSEAKNFKLSVTLLDPANAPANFDISKVAFLPGPYNVAAKESTMPNVAVNMKGVTGKVTLLVKVTVEEPAGSNTYIDYQKPKIVYIQP